MSNQTCGCCCSSRPARIPDAPYIVDRVPSPAGEVPRITTRLSFADHAGNILRRWSIGRNRHRIVPGLYAIGTPGPDSPVLVSANYKMTFDKLRGELGGHNLWLLILDTKGINVWCAAGKGTFSTAGLLRQIEASRLASVVTHRRLILPQLGAPGVSAREVKQASGFSVIFGPVRASDLPEFLKRGGKAGEAMRRVVFPLGQRLAVVPVELVSVMKYYLLYLAAGLAILFFLKRFETMNILKMSVPPLGAILCGVLLVPVLLPVIPARSFAMKGMILGIGWGLASGILFQPSLAGWLGYLLLLPAISGFVALNYTGSTTFTSQSGVNREIALYARPMGLSALSGAAVLLAGIWL